MPISFVFILVTAVVEYLGAATIPAVAIPAMRTAAPTTAIFFGFIFFFIYLYSSLLIQIRPGSLYTKFTIYLNYSHTTSQVSHTNAFFLKILCDFYKNKLKTNRPRRKCFGVWRVLFRTDGILILVFRNRTGALLCKNACCMASLRYDNVPCYTVQSHHGLFLSLPDRCFPVRRMSGRDKGTTGCIRVAGAAHFAAHALFCPV